MGLLRVDPAFSEVHEPDPRILASGHQSFGCIGARVADDYNFNIPIGLLKRRAERPFDQKFSAIVGCDADTDERFLLLINRPISGRQTKGLEGIPRRVARVSPVEKGILEGFQQASNPPGHFPHLTEEGRFIHGVGLRN
jgi:hypothetical protein